LNQATTISAEAWINPCKVNGDNMILTKWWCGGVQNAYYFNVKDGKLRWSWDIDGCGNGSAIYESNQAIIQTNIWQHVAVVHTTIGVTLYYDGSPVGATLINGNYGVIQSSSEPLRIGVYKALNSTFFGHFNGQMDEVRIWDYNVSSADILARYNVPLAGNETGLVAYYDMNVNGSGSGITIPNQATITGSSLNGITIGTTITPLFQPPSNILLGNDTTICTGDTLILSVPANIISYTWSNGSTNNTLTVTQPGTYWISASLGACIFGDTITVTQGLGVSANLGADTTLCQGDTLQFNLSIPNANYLWSDGSTNSNIDITQNGTYWVDVSVNSCSERDSITVNFNPPPSFQFGADTSLCLGNTISLDAFYPASSYLWNTGSTNASIQVSNPGQYWVDVNNICGTVRDTIQVDLIPGPVIDLGSDTIMCTGDTLLLNATTAGASYLWQNNSTNPTQAVMQPGIYHVEVTVNGCNNTDSINVQFTEAPFVDLGSDTTLCEMENLLLQTNTATSDYLWSDGSTNSSLLVNSEGTYSVTAFNNCGTDSSTIHIEYEDCTCSVFIPNAFTPNADNLNEYFKPIHACDFLEYKFQIFNRWGMLIFETENHWEAWDGTHDNDPVPSGTYIYILSYQDEFAKFENRKGYVTLIR
ncbi:MAG: T9SS type B sorting domain-containing protein, partial [Bacteroidia bacterium]|nr:T9SS type B sorting domain-containing protein [Bacteroidia bacterium]